MKLNNIILGLLVSAGLFVACTSEEPVNGASEGEPTTFSIKIASSDATTKAVAANYEYATDDEITVNKVTVAVFKANGTSVGDLVSGPTTVTSSDLTATTSSDGRKAYEITNLVGKTGSAYILVIANSSADYSNCKSYTDFAAITERVTDGKSFTSTNLVKVGIIRVDLAPATTKSTYEIPMNQIAARIDLKVTPVDGLTYQFNKVTVNYINTKSDVLINETNSQDGTIQSTVFNLTAATDTFSFYTFENPIPTKQIKVTFEGTLTETATNSVTPNKIYSFSFDEPVLHGYVYDVKGVLDAATRKMNFSWNFLPWGGSRETDANIQQTKYLVVRNLNISMPNTTTASTTFQSSSPITITGITVSNGTNYANTDKTITCDSGNSGTINITSTIPVNFVPKYISFTVTNLDGLSQKVSIVQYPPLYITSDTTGVTWSDASGQNTKDMFNFTTLVANYSSLPYPDEDDNYTDVDRYGYYYYYMYYSQNNTVYLRWDLGKTYTDYLRQHASFGYPATTSSIIYNFTSTSSGNAGKNYNSASVLTTVDTDENNALISPHFALASQAGMNSASYSFSDKVEFCQKYREYDKNGNDYGPGSWRMPTKAEVYLIDVLQNVKKCDVKKILEGGAYWAADGQLVIMMDPRTGNNYAEGAVRCVRDVK